jgi:hypothetical protein
MGIDLTFRPSSYWGEQPEIEAFRGDGPGRGTAPGFGGGGWLPETADNEVEIARVSLQSTLGDDISIRAKPTAGGIEHSVVDDYGTTYIVKHPIRQEALSLAELIELMDTVYDVDNDMIGLTDKFRDLNFGGGDPQGLVDYVWVRSTLYLQLGEYYDMRAQEWAAGKHAQGDEPPAK